MITHTNECCAKLMESLEADSETRMAAIATLHGEVLRLACEPVGCRLIQRAFEVVDYKVAAELLQELHGYVQKLIRSPHGNYVIQKAIEVFPSRLAGFVAHELCGSAAAVARHRYGCRILCRLVEHSTASLQDQGHAALIDEVLSEAGQLCQHHFAYHVIQAILEHGHVKHQRQVFAALQSNLIRKAQGRFSSCIIQAALDSHSTEDAQALAGELIGSTEANVSLLSQTRFGSNVVKTLLKLSGTASEATHGMLRLAAPQLSNCKYGRRLLQDAGLQHSLAAAATAE